MGLFVAIIAFGVMMYSLFTGSIPVRRRRAVYRTERPVYYWFLILIQAGIFVVGLLDYLGVIHIFNN
jgi:hypothetical protein